MRRTQAGFLLFCGLLAVGGVAGTASKPAADLYEGRPTFKEGSDRAYFVWRDGDSWHVRWTTRGEAHQFTGSVRAGDGSLTDLKRIDLDAELRVIRPGAPPRVVRGPAGRVRGLATGRPAVVAATGTDKVDRAGDRLIRWTARTTADIDGFDFTASHTGSLQFELKIDGVSRPVDVELGRGNVHPAANPFTAK